MRHPILFLLLCLKKNSLSFYFTEGYVVAEEVVVESSLNIRNPMQKPRRIRDVIYYLVPDLHPLVR